MAPSFDHALGQRLAQLIQQNGEQAFEAGVISRRIQAQLQDLLGAETSLLNPLRDLLQRPAFRQLFQLNGQGQLLNGRDALLRDLAEVYSPAVVARLDAVLQGCLNLPGAATPWTTPQPASAQSAPLPSQMAPTAAPASTVVTIPARSQAPNAILIALLALVCGALVMALAGVLISSRNGNGTITTSPSAPTPSQTPAPPTTPTLPERTEQPPISPEVSPPVQWQACLDYTSETSPPPQSGETWWPVVGPADALEASRQHCRSDAYSNASGNVQVASFRDRNTAAAFAQQLTNDNSHPYNFWVGEPSVR